MENKNSSSTNETERLENKLSLEKIKHKHSFYSYAKNKDHIMLSDDETEKFFTQMLKILSTPSMTFVINEDGSISPASPTNLVEKLKLKKIYFDIPYSGVIK